MRSRQHLQGPQIPRAAVSDPIQYAIDPARHGFHNLPVRKKAGRTVLGDLTLDFCFTIPYLRRQVAKQWGRAQNVCMTGLLISVSVLAAIVVLVFGTAALLITGSLTAACALPHGHPAADWLRNFSARVAASGWEMVWRLDVLSFAAALVVGAVLTVALS